MCANRCEVLFWIAWVSEAETCLFRNCVFSLFPKRESLSACTTAARLSFVVARVSEASISFHWMMEAFHLLPKVCALIKMQVAFSESVFFVSKKRTHCLRTTAGECSWTFQELDLTMKWWKRLEEYVEKVPFNYATWVFYKPPKMRCNFSHVKVIKGHL